MTARMMLILSLPAALLRRFPFAANCHRVL